MWGKIDDGWARNAKIRGLSAEAKLLWMHAFAEANREGTEGVVSGFIADDAAHLAKVDLAVTASELVEAALWHDPVKLRSCRDCKEVVGKLEAGCFYFHNWRKYNKTRDELDNPEAARKERRRKELSNSTPKARAIREMLHARDGSTCRYCGERTESVANRPRSRQWEHVDPDGWNQLWNVVTACKECNVRKGDSFPWEAGMRLLPPPYPNGPEGDLPLIPDPTYEGMNPGLTRDPATGWPWGDTGSTQGQPTGQPDGQPVADTGLAQPSRVRATPERGGSGSAPGRPGGQPRVNPGSTTGSTQDEDGQVLPLRPTGTPGGEGA